MNAVIITAAGSSRRMGTGTKKEFLRVDGIPVLVRAILPFLETGKFSQYVITHPPGRQEEFSRLLENSPSLARAIKDITFVSGGDTRQASVHEGMKALHASGRDTSARGTCTPEIVLIHDGARPWVKPDLIFRVLQAAEKHGAAVPVILPVDAVKIISPDGFVSEHCDRSQAAGAQTPQGFRYREIFDAYSQALGDGVEYVDDAAVYGRYRGKVFTVPGDTGNRKITYPEDLGPGKLKNQGPQGPGKLEVRE